MTPDFLIGGQRRNQDSQERENARERGKKGKKEGGP